MPTYFYVIRSTIADPAKRAALDAWYSREHFPDAVKVLGAEKGWRFWSVTDPAVHQATYQFSDRAALERAIASEANKALVALYDRDWPEVVRTRELLVLAEEFGGA